MKIRRKNNYIIVGGTIRNKAVLWNPKFFCKGDAIRLWEKKYNK